MLTQNKLPRMVGEGSENVTGQRRKRDRKLKILIWSPAIYFALNQLPFAIFLVILLKWKKIKRETAAISQFLRKVHL